MKKLTTVLLFLLVFSMLTLWICYISLRFDAEVLEEPILERDFWIFSEQSEESTKTVADGYFFSPLSVSLIFSSNAYTSAYNSHLTHILYESVEVLLNEVLSDSYTCSTADENLWENALKKEDAVFVEYPSSLPYTVMALFLNKTDSLIEGEVCNIKSIIFFNDEFSNLTALSKDEDGKIYSYTYSSSDAPSLIYDFNSNNLAAYTVNKGFIPFEFNINKKENMPPEFKLLSSSPLLSSLSLEFPLKEKVQKALEEENKNALEIAAQKEFSNIFDAFEINPHIVGYYSNSVSGMFFIGQDTVLEISPTGRVRYSLTATDYTPITVSSLLNSEKTDFTSSQLITAATVFLSRFDNNLVGKEASVLLDSMSYSPLSDTFTFNFSYYYELSELLFKGEKAGATLIFNKSGLISADIFTLSITESEEKLSNNTDYLDMSLTPSIVLGMLSSDGDFAPVYNFTENSTLLSPFWMEKKKGENSK